MFLKQVSKVEITWKNRFNLQVMLQGCKFSGNFLISEICAKVLRRVHFSRNFQAFQELYGELHL